MHKSEAGRAINYVVNYQQMVNSGNQSSAILFGESAHDVKSYANEIKKALPILKNMGFTTLGLEMFTSNMEISASSRRQWSAHLNNFWGQGYIEVVDMALKHKINVIGLDIPAGQKCNEYDKFDEGKTVIPCRNSHVSRNHYMADNLAKVMGNGQKVIAFMHLAHSLDCLGGDTGVKTLLNRRNQSTAIVIKLTDRMDELGVCNKKLNVLTNPTPRFKVGQAKSEEERFFRIGPSPLKYENYIIHLKPVPY